MKNFLRVESVVILAGAVGLFWYSVPFGTGWWWFLAFVLLPELAWLAHLRREWRAAWWSALLFNAAHSYALPVLLMVLLWPYRPIFMLGWIANISAWRALGLGYRAAPE